MENDNNNIELLITIGYAFKTFKLFIIIINISFFLGMFWLIYCDVALHIGLSSQPEILDKIYNGETIDESIKNDWFLAKFDYLKMSSSG